MDTPPHKNPGKFLPVRLNKTSPDQDATVVIVGGGLAGLTAAYRLANLSVPHPPKVIVLDAGNAQEMLGGRVGSLQMPSPDGKQVDKISYGGTWLQFEDDDIIGLAAEMHKVNPNLPNIEPIFPDMQEDVHALTYAGTHPWLLLLMWVEGRRATKILKKPAKDLTDGDKKFLHHLDEMSLEGYLTQPASYFSTLRWAENEDNRRGVLNWFAMMENEPWNLAEMSALFACVMVYARLSNIQKTGKLYPQTLRWRYGTGSLIEGIRASLDHLKVTIEQKASVTKISKQGNDYLITYTQDGKVKTVNANRVIVSTSPSVVATGDKEEHGKIFFDPSCGLPSFWKDLQQFFTPWDDASYNIILRFDAPIWLHDGKQTRVFLLAPSKQFDPAKQEMFASVMDLTEKNDHGDFRGQRDIIRFLVDPQRIKGKPVQQIIDEALKYLTVSYENKIDFKKHYLDYKIVDWTICKPWINVTYYWKPAKQGQAGYAEVIPKITEPCGGIHWAGAERSIQGAHWMEGAVHSGNVVAAEVAEAMHYLGGPGRETQKQYLRSIEESNAKGVEHIRGHSPGVGSELKSIFQLLLGSTSADQEDIERHLRGEEKTGWFDFLKRNKTEKKARK